MLTIPSFLLGNIGSGQQKLQLTDIQRIQSNTSTQPQTRRDSNSTVSSYYGSMRSVDMSRKSSLASQASSMRPGVATGSFYDPISLGSSRRSSQLSTATTGGNCVPPPPPSHLLAGQLQRLQTSPNNSSNLVLQVIIFKLEGNSIGFQLLLSLSIFLITSFILCRHKMHLCSKQLYNKPGYLVT